MHERALRVSTDILRLLRRLTLDNPGKICHTYIRNTTTTNQQATPHTERGTPMDYEKEKELQQELRQELAPQIAAALSELLAQTWTHAPREEVSRYTCITGPDGCGLHVDLDTWPKKPRLNITGQWPKSIGDGRGRHSFYPYQDQPHITVAFGRGAQAIAKDISRRFLPKYLPMWEQMVEQRASYMDENKREQEVLARLAAAGGVTHKGTAVRIWERCKIDDPRATATVSFCPDKHNPTVDLKLENIPVSTAETIMALVGQLCDKGER